MTELQSHYKQDKPAGVGEIVEVKPYRKMKGSILLLDTNGVRNKGTPVPDKQFLKEINAMLLILVSGLNSAQIKEMEAVILIGFLPIMVDGYRCEAKRK